MRRLTSTTIVLGALLLATLAAAPGVSAQAADEHPVIGAWIVSTPSGPAIEVFHADGTYTAPFPVSGVPPSGLTYQSTQVGVWEPAGPQTARMSVVFLYSDTQGTFPGSFTYDGSQTVSEDGSSIIADDGGTATVRDANGEVVMVLPADHGVVVGTRMRVGSPGYPVGSPTTSGEPAAPPPADASPSIAPE
jgi:hypothetical protein